MKKTFTLIFSIIMLTTTLSAQEIFLIKKENGKLKEIAFNPLSIKNNGTKPSPEQVLKDFIEKRKLNIDFNNLKLIQKSENRHTVTLRYKQTANNLPVFNSEVVGVIYKGNVLKMVNNTFSEFSSPEFADITTLEKKVLAENGNFKKILETEKGYFGETPCYRLRVAANKDLLDIFIDGKTGEILKKKSLLINFDSQGKVFYPNPVCYSGDTSLYDNDDENYEELQDKYITVTLKDIDPSGVLKNKYVDLTARGIIPAYQMRYSPISDYTPGSAVEINGGYFYGRDNYAFEEVNAYYWITEARKYIESLGFNILPDPIPVNVHYMTNDKSFYTEADHGLHFGDGGVDDAEDAEIILHEFMHAVTHYIVPGLGDSWEAAALDEGLCDYFAATFSNDKIFRDYIGEWDATTYNPGNPSYLRPIKTDRHYPEDMRETYYLTGTADYHWDGVIFSSTLWQIRKAVGKDFDRDVIEFLYHISTSTSFQSAAMSVYTADILNGSNFKEAIGYFFYKRGILPESYLSEVEEQDGYKIYFPYAEESAENDCYLGLINTSQNQTIVKIDYIASEGFLVLKEKEITLSPGEKYFEKVNPDEIDTKFWLMATSSEPIKGYIYFIDKNKTKSSMLKGIERISDTVYVPHIAPETDYWESYSAIANCTSNQTTISVDTHEGEIIQLDLPDNKFTMNYLEWHKDFYNKNDIQPENNWVTLNSNSQNLAAYQFFVRKDINQVAALDLDIQPSNILYFPHIHVEGNYWWSGIVFENTFNSNREAIISAYDTEGNTLDTFTIEMKPFEKTVCLAQNLWTDHGREFPENTAWIKILSPSQCLIGYQLFGTLPDMGERLLSGINAITRPAQKILFPHIKSGDDFWTGIAVINASQSQSNITLKAYDNLGNLLEEANFTNINSNEKKVFLVKDIFTQETTENTAYIIAESDGLICGFEISGNQTAIENGETIERQDYIAGMEGINLNE